MSGWVVKVARWMRFSIFESFQCSTMYSLHLRHSLEVIEPGESFDLDADNRSQFVFPVRNENHCLCSLASSVRVYYNEVHHQFNEWREHSLERYDGDTLWFLGIAQSGSTELGAHSVRDYSPSQWLLAMLLISSSPLSRTVKIVQYPKFTIWKSIRKSNSSRRVQSLGSSYSVVYW